MPNAFVEIADQLGPLFHRRKEVEIQVWKLERTIARRQVEMVPADGWTGKNAEAREQARDLAFEHDPDLMEWRDELRSHKEALGKIEADIDELDARRRALEWGVREKMVTALEQGGINRNNARSDVAEAGIDDATQAKTDNGLHDFLEEEARWDGSLGEPETQAKPGTYEDFLSGADLPF